MVDRLLSCLEKKNFLTLTTARSPPRITSPVFHSLWAYWRCKNPVPAPSYPIKTAGLRLRVHVENHSNHSQLLAWQQLIKAKGRMAESWE